MPLHDWTKLPDYAYHEFHGRWIYAICHALNAGVLPAGYYARPEQVTRPAGPDVVTFELPDLPPADSGRLPWSVADTPPRVAVAAVAPPRPVAQAQKRVTVRLGHGSGDRVVAIVELVSRGNKLATKRFAAFVRKLVRAIDGGVHVLVIDPFPPGVRDPAGVHGAVWPELGGDTWVPPHDKPLALVAYEAGDAARCYVEPLAAGDRLTDMPLFLRAGRYVNVPLEASYQAAFADMLPQDRAALEA